MRIGVVTDSTCDLPKDFIDANRIVVLPITIRIGGKSMVDDHDPAKTLAFYHGDLWDRAHNGESNPFTVGQIENVFLDRLVLDFDYVFCITVMGERSPIYANAAKASFRILSRYREARRGAGLEGRFALRVIDSQNVFSGQGVLVAEAVRMVKSGLPVSRVRSRVEKLRSQVYAYMVPDDLYYLRKRARQKGDHSVGALQYLVGSALNIRPVVRCHANETRSVYKGKGFAPTVEKLFDLTVAQIEKGLKAPSVVVGYGGAPEKVREMPGFARLERAAGEHGIDLHLTFMSITAGINVGAGALTVGFAADDHEFQ